MRHPRAIFPTLLAAIVLLAGCPAGNASLPTVHPPGPGTTTTPQKASVAPDIVLATPAPISNSAADVVFAHYKRAKDFDSQSRHAEALDEYKLAAQAFWDNSLPTASAVANVAAESAFQLAEEQFAIYKVKKFSWTNPTSEASVNSDLDKLVAEHKAVAKYYQDIDRYVTPWTVAADVRLADIAFEAGEKLLSAAIPPLGPYEISYIRPFRDAAKKLWQKAIRDAKAKGFSNEWTERARKSLHDIDPNN